MGLEFEPEQCGKRIRLQIRHFACTDFVRDSTMVGWATKTTACKPNSRLLRVNGVAGPMETPFWAEFGDLPKAKLMSVFLVLLTILQSIYTHNKSLSS